MNKADHTEMMSKGEGGSKALKCCLGNSASVGITVSSPGFCVLMSEVPLLLHPYHAPKSSKCFPFALVIFHGDQSENQRFPHAQ